MSKWIQVWGKESGDESVSLLFSFPVSGSLEECRSHAESSKKMLEESGATEVTIKEVEEKDG